ncbi:MAG: hypothetical protein ABFD96_13020 [Armatimonadia bacterium]
MEIRVSPAVTVVVLIVVGAILVGLYYMVMAEPGTKAVAGMVGPAPEIVPPTAAVEPTSTTAPVAAGDKKEASAEAKKDAAATDKGEAAATETKDKAAGDGKEAPAPEKKDTAPAAS